MTSEQKETPQIGRNEPCPCGSGKKYKRCCGVSAAPRLSTPAAFTPPMAGGAAGEGMPDLSKLDPTWMNQFAQAMQRLPRAHVQRLQTLVQKAMAGKDVSRDAAELEKVLPPDFQSLLMSFKMPEGMMPGMDVKEGDTPTEMTEEKAKAIVAEAVASGKISQDEAQNLLADGAPIAKETEKEKTSGIGKFWKNITGNKE